ncbi:MAG: hypothetical protein AABW71_03620 [Nanoarchaeota archaeon]
MIKKRRTKEIIEADERPRDEYGGVKFPGDELVDIADRRSSGRVETNWDKLRKEWIKKGKIKYTGVHTHPTEKDKDSYEAQIGEDLEMHKKLSGIPSKGDLVFLLKDDQRKSEAIAVREPDTGKLRGYLVIRKTKDTPVYKGSPVKHTLRYLIHKWIENPILNFLYATDNPPKNTGWQQENTLDKKQMKQRLNIYLSEIHEAYHSKDAKLARVALDRVTHDFHLKYRYVSADGYELGTEGTHFVKKGLEKRIAGATAIIGFLGSLFSSYKFTGNIIGTNYDSISLVSLILFIIGLVGLFFYFKVRNF